MTSSSWPGHHPWAYASTALLFGAGVWSALHPSPSIDALFSNRPATVTLGAWLALASAVRANGLARGRLELIKFGLIGQVVVLGIFGVALTFISAAGVAYGLAMWSHCCQLVVRYRGLALIVETTREVRAVRDGR